MIQKLVNRIVPLSGEELSDKANALFTSALIIGMFFSIWFSVIDFSMGYEIPALANVFMFIGFGFAIWLMSLRKALISKVVMILVLNIVIAVHSLLFTPFNYLIVFYIPVIVSIAVIFRRKEMLYGWLLGGICIFSITSLTLTDYRLPGAYMLTADEIKIQWALNFTGAAIISLVLMYYVVRINETIHQKLIEQKQIVHTNNITLQDTIRTRDKLFSLIAHDMKGPFQSMAASLEILKAGDTSNEDKQMVINHLSRRAENTIIMLNNLLLWSQTQVDSIRYKPEIITIEKLLSTLAVNFKMQAENKDIKININSPGNLVVYADKVMLESVLRNLVSNAIKFTPSRGMVSLNIDHAGDKVHFQVLDNGVGMDELVLEMLRNRQSYSSSGTNREQGHGLGLLLVQEFLKLHQSELRIESEKNKGSQFSFLIRQA